MLENFLMYMDQEIEPNQIIWVIRQNANNEYYLDVGKCIGFKVIKERNKNNYVWKIGIRSLLTHQLIYNKLSNLNETIFFNMNDAMIEASNNVHTIILHYGKIYKFYTGDLYKIIQIEKTNHGVIYHCQNCNNKQIRKIANKDIDKHIIDFIH